MGTEIVRQEPPTHLLKSQIRFVLSSSGHIAGIVNPPGPKGRHWLNPETPADPEDWLAGAECKTGSWWEDWATWIETRAGHRRPPPSMGSTNHLPLSDAPGSYILEK